MARSRARGTAVGPALHGLLRVTNTLSNIVQTPRIARGAVQHLGGVVRRPGDRSGWFLDPGGARPVQRPRRRAVRHRGPQRCLRTDAVQPEPQRVQAVHRCLASQSLEFRADATNVTNTVSFAAPTATVTSTTFGRIGFSTVSGLRKIQLGFVVRVLKTILIRLQSSVLSARHWGLTTSCFGVTRTCVRRRRSGALQGTTDRRRQRGAFQGTTDYDLGDPSAPTARPAGPEGPALRRESTPEPSAECRHPEPRAFRPGVTPSSVP